jgi:hypothetical protein
VVGTETAGLEHKLNVPAENCYNPQQTLNLTPAIRPEIQTNNECTKARETVASE